MYLGRFGAIENGVRLGEFSKSLSLLEANAKVLQPIDPLRFGTIRAELLHYTGCTAAAATLATELLRSPALGPEWAARLTYVLGRSSFERWKFSRSSELLGRSVALAKACGNTFLVARSQLELLALFLEEAKTQMPLLPEVRTAVARSGDPHLMVSLRLYFARAEASRHSPEEARRHLLAADHLLAEFPNLWLKGRVHLGLSVVDNLCGEPQSAFEQANQAIRCASISGHVRTEMAGLINLSHALQTTGRWADARQCITSVLDRAGDDPEIRIFALDSLSNVWIGLGSFDKTRDTIREIEALLSDKGGALYSRWTSSTLTETRIRLLQAEGSWSLADEALRKAMDAAEVVQDRAWRDRFRLLRLTGLVVAKRFLDAGRELAELEKEPQSLDTMCRRMGILGSAAVLSGRFSAGSAQIRRAERISTWCGNLAFRVDLDTLRTAWATDLTPVDETAVLPSPDLDTAVALLELGGHPHILAREAVAVLEGAGCAVKIALVALGANGPRVIETRGWDERGAVAAARRPQGYEVLPLGRYRDEPWQLIVEPRPELDHRCTLIAIRKIIASALTLDRHRREEKQRAALWPAEALDADPDSI